MEHGTPNIRAGMKVLIRLFGSGFVNKTYIALTERAQKYGESCNFIKSATFLVQSDFNSQTEAITTTSTVEIVAPLHSDFLFLCVSNDNAVSLKRFPAAAT